MQQTIDELTAANKELLANIEILNSAATATLAPSVNGTNNTTLDPAMVQPGNNAGTTQLETKTAEMQQTIDELTAANKELSG